MDLKKFSPIFALLLAVGIIFGTFEQFQNNIPFGFAWFYNMLWFVIGFPVLLVIGLLLFSLAVRGQKMIEEDED